MQRSWNLHEQNGDVCIDYGVARVSRIDQITGLFCRISSLLLDSFAKETYNFIDPTDGSHPILTLAYIYVCFCVRPSHSNCACVYVCVVKGHLFM